MTRPRDFQCARCGSSISFEECEACGGDGETAPGELYEQDPLWYDEDDTEPCHQCGGTGGWSVCLADAAWCKAHPMPGREDVRRGTVETFEDEEEWAGASCPGCGEPVDLSGETSGAAECGGKRLPGVSR